LKFDSVKNDTADLEASLF